MKTCAVLSSPQQSAHSRGEMPEVRNVGKYTIALGEGTPKHGEKNALSPIYRYAAVDLERSLRMLCMACKASITPHDI